MKVNEIITEEYIGMKEWNGNHFPIFKNPSKSELKDLILDSATKKRDVWEVSMIRFLYTTWSNDIYFHSGDLLHNLSIKYLGFMAHQNLILTGIASINKDKTLTITELHFPKKIEITNWDMLNKYFTNCNNGIPDNVISCDALMR